MKGIIVFKGKYGATEQYAQWLADELQLPMMREDEITPAKLRMFDFVVIAGSVYIGKWMMREWLKENIEILQNKKLFFLFVCGTSASQSSKQEQLAKANIPVLLHDASQTNFLPGRVIMRNLTWKDRFLLKMGAMLQKDPVTRARMLSDVDDVSKENLDEVIKRIKAYQFTKYGSSRVWRKELVGKN